MSQIARLAFVVAGFALVAPGMHAELRFQSGPAQVALVELYTSEGCSSCPPAEKWLGELRGDAGLWTRFVPVAFHVNYWDHLGWRDAFATKGFTQRQHAYADAWRANSVYTPCVVRNGAEFAWRDGLRLDRPTAVAGVLAVAWQDNGTCRITYTPPPDAKDAFVANVALLGGGIVSKVKSGENSGRELRHEFVVLQLAAAPLAHADERTLATTVTIAALTDRALPAFSRRALAAWVTPRGDLAPVQATGGWLVAP
jgi:hypothetical protein